MRPVPLFLENLPPLFEYVIYESSQMAAVSRSSARKCMKKVYPFIIGLAYILPIMHQSSLGALMLLGGNRVYPLWQTPFLPLIYVWAAAFLGYNCVVLCLLLAKIAWKRDVDPEVLAELNKITVLGRLHLDRFPLRRHSGSRKDSPGPDTFGLLPPVLDRDDPDCGIGLRSLLGEG